MNKILFFLFLTNTIVAEAGSQRFCKTNNPSASQLDCSFAKAELRNKGIDDETINSGNFLIDSKEKKVWTKLSQESKFQAALEQCDSLKTEQPDFDWRLPTIKEIQSFHKNMDIKEGVWYWAQDEAVENYQYVVGGQRNVTGIANKQQLLYSAYCMGTK